METPALSRADINAKLGYLEPEALETVLARLRSTGLMVWDQSQSVYRITPMARNALAAGIESLVQVEQQDDQAEMSYMLTQIRWGASGWRRLSRAIASLAWSLN